MTNIYELLSDIKENIADPTKGLPEEIFLFATEITTMVNVDLLIKDDKGRILLSWRDDEFYGKGWHVPGGIIRLKETFEDRIQKTAESEIGVPVVYEENPLKVVPIICPEMKTRGHFITFIYSCKLPDGFFIENHGKKRNDAGYLEWHETFPEDMLKVHNFYKKYFNLEK